MEEIQYLYHYTSIEKLALILKNRTIRLNPLDKMDDLQEKKTEDVKGMGQFVYVSCWTEDEEEQIPMWNMYTDIFSGVRIKMRKYPFVRYQFPVSRLKQYVSRNNMEAVVSKEEDYIYVEFNMFYEKNFAISHFFGEDILHKVIYTNELEKLEPKVSNIENSQVELKVNGLGKYKNKYWEFQKESRYILSIYPHGMSQDILEKERYNSEQISKMVKGELKSPFSYIDLKLTPLAYDDMEITISPKMSVGNRILLEALVEKYNPKVKIKESKLLGKI